MHLFTTPIDEDITGSIFAQAQEIFFIFDPDNKHEGKKEKFYAQLFDIMTKLQALKYHLRNYEQKEKEHIRHVTEEFKKNPHVSEAAYDLLFELEAFLFQLKSALDISVKLIGVLFPNRFRVRTFGAKGEDLIKGLENFANDKSARQETIKSIIAVIEEDKDSWLTQAINLRDTISHYKTFAQFRYGAINNNGEIEVLKPIIAGLEVLEYMKLAYSNCLGFIQDLMCLSIELFLPPVFQIGKSQSQKIGPPLDKYIKFSLYFSDKAKIR